MQEIVGSNLCRPKFFFCVIFLIFEN
jgi:hypothetical protein